MKQGSSSKRSKLKHEDAASLAKKMLETSVGLRAISSYGNSKENSHIPATLDSDEDERLKLISICVLGLYSSKDTKDEDLEKIGKMVDKFIDSDVVQKMRTDREMQIIFDCERYNKVGTLGKGLCMTK